MQSVLEHSCSEDIRPMTSAMGRAIWNATPLPCNDMLEIQLLMGEGKTTLASECARYWVKRLQRRGYSRAGRAPTAEI